ncbi:hypothetical protein [Streptomonospora alba]|uniref:hypothetical protein n=1 Tax=Streptomonospora alba TaxID=183763 RepID=UPI0012ED69F6|nr:hypothetical protein [Streptomonospora alba]
MGVDDRDFRRATEDVHFVPVGEELGYTSDCSGPVRYRTVARNRGADVLGYLWHNDDEHAAGYVPQPAGGDAAFNAGSYWNDRLTEAEQRGLAPSAAVEELEKRVVGGEPAGWIVPGSEDEASSVQQLRNSAGMSSSGNRPLQQPDAPRRRERGA